MQIKYVLCNSIYYISYENGPSQSYHCVLVHKGTYNRYLVSYTPAQHVNAAAYIAYSNPNLTQCRGRSHVYQPSPVTCAIYPTLFLIPDAIR